MNPSSWFGADGDSSLKILWEDGERVFCRREGHADGYRAAVLAVLPAAEHPTPATLDRLAHEYGLKDDLDAAWAVRPLELVRERGRTMLVLEDRYRSESISRGKVEGGTLVRAHEQRIERGGELESLRRGGHRQPDAAAHARVPAGRRFSGQEDTPHVRDPGNPVAERKEREELPECGPQLEIAHHGRVAGEAVRVVPAKRAAERRAGQVERRRQRISAQERRFEERIPAPVLLRRDLQVEEQVREQLSAEGARGGGANLAESAGAVEQRGGVTRGDPKAEAAARSQRAADGVERQSRFAAAEGHPSRSVEPIRRGRAARDARDVLEEDPDVRAQRSHDGSLQRRERDQLLLTDTVEPGGRETGIAH